MWTNLAIADLLAPTFRPMGPEDQFVQRYRELVGSAGGHGQDGGGRCLRPHRRRRVSPRSGSPGSSSATRSRSADRTRSSTATSASTSSSCRSPVHRRLAVRSLLIVLIVTAVAHYLNGGIRFQTAAAAGHAAGEGPPVGAARGPRAAEGGRLLPPALRAGVLHRGVGRRGAGYTDVNAQLPALNLLLFISLFAPVLFLVNIRRRGWVLPVIAVGLWALISVVVGGIYPAVVQRFRVQPTESTKERPYIQRNITATRAAFNLADTEVTDFEATWSSTPPGSSATPTPSATSGCGIPQYSKRPSSSCRSSATSTSSTTSTSTAT